MKVAVRFTQAFFYAGTWKLSEKNVLSAVAETFTLNDLLEGQSRSLMASPFQKSNTNNAIVACDAEMKGTTLTQDYFSSRINFEYALYWRTRRKNSTH